MNILVLGRGKTGSLVAEVARDERRFGDDADVEAALFGKDGQQALGDAQAASSAAEG